MQINDKGFIVINRKITEWEWYQDIPTFKLFTHLLFVANHQDIKWQGKIIKRGQRLTSLGHLAKETGLSVQKIRTSINKLKSTHEITSESNNQYTVITLLNYNKYQYNNRQITNEQQTSNNKQQ